MSAYAGGTTSGAVRLIDGFTIFPQLTSTGKLNI